MEGEYGIIACRKILERGCYCALLRLRSVDPYRLESTRVILGKAFGGVENFDADFASGAAQATDSYRQLVVSRGLGEGRNYTRRQNKCEK